MTTMESLPKQYESLESMLFLFGEDRFPKLAMKHRGEFAQGKPFPHVVIDDFLPHEASMRTSSITTTRTRRESCNRTCRSCTRT
jgi:hypothetical protein